MEWLKKVLCKLASKIINKYDYHYLNLDSKIVLHNRVFHITDYNFTESIHEFPSISIGGISPLVDLKKVSEE